jgi:phosphoribosyl-ATP pyrophosphohydrolase/phosphoribosyl-AMP cyclohydrolase
MKQISTVIDLGKTVSFDLSSSDVIWENIISKNRNMIRKVEKNGIEIRHGKGLELFADFKRIYNATMDKDHAEEYYYFGDAFYASIHNDLHENYEMFYAVMDGQIIAMSIMLYGNKQKVKEISYDCDGDTLLIKVHQTGVACHTGTYTCFSGRKLVEEKEKGLVVVEPEQETSLATVLNDLYNVIQERQLNPVEGSYTNYLFEKGQDKILKKVGEEAVETVIASKNNKSEEVLYEMGDLWYHCLVLLAYHKLTPDQLLDELMSRRKGGNYHKFTGKTGVRPDM